MGVKPNPWIVDAYWKCILLLNPPSGHTLCTAFPAPAVSSYIQCSSGTPKQAAQKHCFEQTGEIWKQRVQPTTHHTLGFKALGSRKGFKARLPRANWENLTVQVVAPSPTLLLAFNTILTELNLIEAKVVWFGNKDGRERLQNIDCHHMQCAIWWQPMCNIMQIPCEVLPSAPPSLMPHPLSISERISPYLIPKI